MATKTPSCHHAGLLTGQGVCGGVGGQGHAQQLLPEMCQISMAFLEPIFGFLSLSFQQ